MNRIDVIQKIIDHHNFNAYLEIGTFRGKSFLPIECKYKYAVDPNFQIEPRFKRKWFWKNPGNIRNKYFELTSDDFFKNKKDLLIKKGKLDVIFIDGLHTFQASLKDVLNSLEYLNKEGYIIIHDCLPPHRAAAIPANSIFEAKEMGVEDWTGEWCGDVWKTIVYLKEKFSRDLEVCVLNTDYGLGIIRIKNDIKLELERDEQLFKKINKLNYDYLNENPEEIINLKDKNFLISLLENKTLVK